MSRRRRGRCVTCRGYAAGESASPDSEAGLAVPRAAGLGYTAGQSQAAPGRRLRGSGVLQAVEETLLPSVGVCSTHQTLTHVTPRLPSVNKGCVCVLACVLMCVVCPCLHGWRRRGCGENRPVHFLLLLGHHVSLASWGGPLADISNQQHVQLQSEQSCSGSEALRHLSCVEWIRCPGVGLQCPLCQ